jgi:hypothetical protein
VVRACISELRLRQQAAFVIYERPSSTWLQ